MRREPKVLSVVQREQINRRHEYLSELERFRYYTLSPKKIALIQKRRGVANRLGFALQLCYLRYPGRALQPQETVPEAIAILCRCSTQCTRKRVQAICRRCIIGE
ncbi:MAG: DUF4158 domain-containing protein [Cyanobacteria bacterium P01_A01_bin.37]